MPEATIVPKNWGKEIIHVNSELYCLKELYLNRSYQCSLHFHGRKTEDFVMRSGTMLLVVARDLFRGADSWEFNHNIKLIHELRDTKLVDENRVEFWNEGILYHPYMPFPDVIKPMFDYVVMRPGDTYRITPFTPHFFFGLENSHFTEVSTQHFDEDSHRIFESIGPLLR